MTPKVTSTYLHETPEDPRKEFKYDQAIVEIKKYQAVDLNDRGQIYKGMRGCIYAPYPEFLSTH